MHMFPKNVKTKTVPSNLKHLNLNFQAYSVAILTVHQNFKHPKKKKNQTDLQWMILLSLTGFFSPLFSEKSQSYLTSWQNIILLVNHTKSLKPKS